jgi:hypothetical protein
VLPITTAENDYLTTHGLEALEQRLEDEGALFTDPLRASAI